MCSSDLIEASINASVINNNNLTWNIYANMTWNKNKIIKLSTYILSPANKTALRFLFRGL